MAEVLTDPNQLQAAASFNAEAAVAAAEAETQATKRTLEFGGVVYQTNLPQGVDVLRTNPNDPNSPRPSLRLSEVDRLPVGEFSMLGTQHYTDSEGQEKSLVHDIKIGILGTPEGKAVDQQHVPQHQSGDGKVSPGTERLMEALGFVIDDAEENKTIKAYPTPETLKLAAGKRGVDIEFFPDTDVIEGANYLKAFADKKYPVSDGHYAHDVEDDHLTGVVLGGEPLKVALSEVATRAIESGDQRLIDGTSRSIDLFTSILRSAMGDGPIANYPGGRYAAMESLQKHGKGMGMSAEQVDEILTTAQDNARDLGFRIV